MHRTSKTEKWTKVYVYIHILYKSVDRKMYLMSVNVIEFFVKKKISIRSGCSPPETITVTRGA
jgi:hypothetical protein